MFSSTVFEEIWLIGSWVTIDSFNINLAFRFTRRGFSFWGHPSKESNVLNQDHQNYFQIDGQFFEMAHKLLEKDFLAWRHLYVFNFQMKCTPNSKATNFLALENLNIGHFRLKSLALMDHKLWDIGRFHSKFSSRKREYKDWTLAVSAQYRPLDDS